MMAPKKGWHLELLSKLRNGPYLPVEAPTSSDKGTILIGKRYSISFVTPK